MPLYSYHCKKCNRTDDRHIRLVDFDKEAHNQRCECGSLLAKLVTAPVLAGLDSGPDGFMRNRQEDDGCSDEFTRRRVKKNVGGTLGGGFFVPGLCREGKQFDPFAVCHSRDEVIKKARQLGVGVRGPGINVEPRLSEAAIKEKEEDDGIPSAAAVKHTVVEEIKNNHGGRVTRKKYREIVDAMRDKHRRRTPKAGPTIDSIYGDASIYE